MRITSSALLNALLTIILLTSMFFVGTTTSRSGSSLTTGAGEYDPWVDYNDDGRIDHKDLLQLAAVYGTSGKPINKTELLLGKVPILHVGDWWIMEFVSNETTYTLTQNVTGEGSDYYVRYLEYDPPFQGMHNRTGWVDKSTISPVRMQGQGEYTYDNTTVPYTYNGTIFYVYYGGVPFPLIVGKELNGTETYTMTYTMIIDGTPYTHKYNYTYAYTFRVEAIEKVTVPAGTFTCFKIDMWNATSGDLMYTAWHSDEVKTWIKYIDYTTTPETIAELKDYSV